MREKGVQTRTWIKEKAYGLFVEKGFSAVTMKDICEECNLSRGGLYRHYGSTRQIFEDILQELSEGDDVWVQKQIHMEIPAPEILDQMLEHMRCEMLDHENSLSYALLEFSCTCDKHFMVELNQKARKKWLTLLEYGTTQGSFASVNMEQMTDFILYVYQGARM